MLGVRSILHERRCSVQQGAVLFAVAFAVPGLGDARRCESLPRIAGASDKILGQLRAGELAPARADDLAWGLLPFLVGDAMKLAVAALLLPLAWRLVGSARA